MPIGTPFHPRTSELCTSLFYKDWAGYHTVCSYDTCHEREYYALRNAAGLIDVSPLYKYEVYGKDAAAFLSRVMVRNVRNLDLGRCTYLCWCDDHGKVLDDGTVSRLDDTYFRVTAAEPTLSWLLRLSRRFDVTIEDSTDRIGTLSLQGPNSREILKNVCDADMDNLRYFDLTRAKLDGVDVVISRTGYTGDLGYEIWVEREQALNVYDAVMAAGRDYRIQPVGLDAMDVTRIEAGYIMNGVDYFSANACSIESRKSSPYEIGLGWTVDLDRDPFIGQDALKAEKANGSEWATVGLVYDWPAFERLFAEFGLPPQLPGGAWRIPVPVYNKKGLQVGQGTSGAWSAILKDNLALATVKSAYAKPGTILQIEVTVEFERRRVPAVVTKTPFYDPPRKKA
ncbi:MAG: aminomethyl transferase family protein [Gammaproteobacteria bacterium]|jgi:aminomethyltransferase|nr:aminomethyl transferase family protein [Gammaproteobacteria bacterium]